jgi:hypothetical protein
MKMSFCLVAFDKPNPKSKKENDPRTPKNAPVQLLTPRLQCSNHSDYFLPAMAR